jgi:hypothetical protein
MHAVGWGRGVQLVAVRTLARRAGDGALLAAFGRGRRGRDAVGLTVPGQVAGCAVDPTAVDARV